VGLDEFGKCLGMVEDLFAFDRETFKVLFVFCRMDTKDDSYYKYPNIPNAHSNNNHSRHKNMGSWSNARGETTNLLILKMAHHLWKKVDQQCSTAVQKQQGTKT
jgi:hypothetical protein